MNRFVILTVGKTHSGKTTFAKALEKEMANSVVIDQDNHAEFLHTHYRNLLPQKGANTIKYALTQMIVDYAVNVTDCHLIVCNSNRTRNGRLHLLEQFRGKGFSSVIVNFDLPEHILNERVANSQRSTNILRTVSTFKEVLIRQENETNQGDVIMPIEGEADHLFVINSEEDVQLVIKEIVHLTTLI